MAAAPFYSQGSEYWQTYPAEQEEEKQLRCEKHYICPGLKCIEDVLVNECMVKLFTK